MSHTPDLRAQIMNLQCVVPAAIEGDVFEIAAYKFGHRDARHAAADLANKADETIATLRTALTTQAEESAKLIEQRDELLAALKLTSAVCAGHSMTKSGLVNALEAARAAIEKATN